jgi:hypothetical protein
MRHLPLFIALSLVPTVAEAAAPSWLDHLLAPQPAALHHRLPRGKTPAAIPAAAKSPAPAAAAADATPPVPLPRPRPQQATPAAASQPAPATPAPAQPQSPTSASGSAAAPTSAEGESTTPAPPRVYQTACPAVITGLVEARPLPPIADGRCQEQSPLSVTSILVNGRMLPLSAPAIFNCGMATDLPGWVAEVDSFIGATQKTRIKSVIVGGSYECRDRNVEGGSSDLSEHGRADALDFVGFALEDGRQLTVGADYNSADAPTNRLMHFAHDAACTRFTTVLGPDANALHHDHFHLDLGCHGKTCTYRLCE